LFDRHLIVRRVRSFIRRVYHPLVLFSFLWLFLTAFNLIRTGQHWFVVAIATTIVFGFLLTFFVRFSYYGSLLMSLATIFFVSLQIFLTYFVQSPYAFPIIVTVLGTSILLVHFLTRTRIVLFHGMIFFFVTAYIMTALLAFYMEGTEAGADQWTIFTSLFSIGFLLLVPLNFSFRQHIVGEVIDIADFDIYSKIAQQLRVSVKSRADNRASEIDDEIDKIVSELTSAVNSFIQGYCEGSIIHSCNIIEGLDRIFYSWMKMDEKHKFLKEEKEALSYWRENIAHSNVRKLLAPPKRRKKEKKKRKKLENRYIKSLRNEHEKALNSIAFVMQAISYMTG
jgi:hypothetical protein